MEDIEVKFKKIRYNDLNGRQQENHNFHIVAAKLAEYGFNSLKLNDDWQGADFIAVHIDGKTMLKVQLKGRFEVSKKYIGKNIWIAFIEKSNVFIYSHDLIISQLQANITNSKSWIDGGAYSWTSTPKFYKDLLTAL